MFFKNDNKIDQGAVNTAFFATFMVWAAILLVNSALEFYNNDPILGSFSTLVIGLIVFFLTEIIATKIRKSQINK